MFLMIDVWCIDPVPAGDFCTAVILLVSVLASVGSVSGRNGESTASSSTIVDIAAAAVVSTRTGDNTFISAVLVRVAVVPSL